MTLFRMESEVHIDMYDDRLEIYSPGGMMMNLPLDMPGGYEEQERYEYYY